MSFLNNISRSIVTGFRAILRLPPIEYPKLRFGMSNCLDNDRVSRVWMMASLFALAMLVIILPAYFFDNRVLNDAPIWAKPIKFSLALAIHFVTLLILAQQLERERRAGITLTFFAYTAVASMLFEVLYITIQASRGRQSHYNHETSFEHFMFSMMGIGAVFLVLASFFLGLMIWRYGKKDGSGLRLGSILGLILGSALTLHYAMTMANISSQSHLVGQVVSHAKIPFLGWSLEVGDLRIPHFVATHMMQILPLAGWILDRYKFRSKWLVLSLALFLTASSSYLFTLALSGKPILFNNL
jgi:hypothetical protein